MPCCQATVGLRDRQVGYATVSHTAALWVHFQPRATTGPFTESVGSSLFDRMIVGVSQGRRATVTCYMDDPRSAQCEVEHSGMSATWPPQRLVEGNSRSGTWMADRMSDSQYIVCPLGPGLSELSSSRCVCRRPARRHTCANALRCPYGILHSVREYVHMCDVCLHPVPHAAAGEPSLTAIHPGRGGNVLTTGIYVPGHGWVCG